MVCSSSGVLNRDDNYFIRSSYQDGYPFGYQQGFESFTDYQKTWPFHLAVSLDGMM
jgi:hypothetical protein